MPKDNERGKLNEKERKEADKDHKQRENMPASAFLEGESRKYPVKVERDGEWKYDRDLLLAAEREAEMHGHSDLAAKAKRIREHQFSDSAHDELKFAIDRSSVRSFDVDGRLHVALTNISKATVNPYYGHEIPGWRQLGLDPDRIYQLFRSPEELAKAAPTFNGIQLLWRHVEVSADVPMKEDVVGTTGSDARFVDPYLQNSLVVWDSAAIAGIETREQQELSCAYRYVPVMTPGIFNGMPYDGLMTEIIGNHVALVETGRAGPDVLVWDSNPFMESVMKSKANGKTIAVRAAVRAYLRPKLASDAALDLKGLVGTVKTMTEAQAKVLAKNIHARAKLAKDADISDLYRVIMDAAESEEEEKADDEETEEERKARETEEAKKKAEDDEEEERKKEEEAKKAEDKKAMDAAIHTARKEAEDNAIKRMRSIQQAEREVHPLIGEVAAQDSAEAVYKMALDHAQVDLTDVHPSAYRALVRQIVSNKPRQAHDSESSNAFWDGFKGIQLPTRI